MREVDCVRPTVPGGQRSQAIAEVHDWGVAAYDASLVQCRSGRTRRPREHPPGFDAGDGAFGGGTDGTELLVEIGLIGMQVSAGGVRYGTMAMPSTPR